MFVILRFGSHPLSINIQIHLTSLTLSEISCNILITTVCLRFTAQTSSVITDLLNYQIVTVGDPLVNRL